MWAFLNNAFLSIVADRDDPDRLLVCACFRDDVVAVFPGVDVAETPGTDYCLPRLPAPWRSLRPPSRSRRPNRLPQLQGFHSGWMAARSVCQSLAVFLSTPKNKPAFDLSK